MERPDRGLILFALSPGTFILNIRHHAGNPAGTHLLETDDTVSRLIVLVRNMGIHCDGVAAMGSDKAETK